MRILIPTVTAGAGHLQAASAIEEAWRALRPADTLEKMDVLDFTPRLYKKIYVKGYLQLVKHAPEVYAMVFKKTDNPARLKKLARLRRTFARITTQPFVKSILKFQPDAVICPHYLPLEILGGIKAKRRRGPAPLVVCVVTDFEAHALWMEPCVGLYCVATEETKARLIARGAPSEHVVVTGIPIAAKFAARPPVAALQRHYRLRQGITTLLVLGGGFGLGPVEEILSELDKVEKPVQTLVVCGRNEKLRKKLAAQPRRQPTHLLGFADNMHELMAASDLILTKPGGLTTSESLALGKPLIILNPIPGQEAANSDFLLERGAAIKINRVEDLPFRLGQLIGAQKLGDMARAAKHLGRPNAAQDICLAVLQRLAPDRVASSTGALQHPAFTGVRGH
jgi:processive 1,2-diacylglycerol beta-glucosyltransferase